MTGPVVATTDSTAAVVKSTDDRLAGRFSARASETGPAATDMPVWPRMCGLPVGVRIIHVLQLNA
jgi:hypothetical protein